MAIVAIGIYRILQKAFASPSIVILVRLDGAGLSLAVRYVLPPPPLSPADECDHRSGSIRTCKFSFECSCKMGRRVCPLNSSFHLPQWRVQSGNGSPMLKPGF